MDPGGGEGWVHVESNVGAATIRAEIERDAAGLQGAVVLGVERDASPIALAPACP